MITVNGQQRRVDKAGCTNLFSHYPLNERDAFGYIHYARENVTLNREQLRKAVRKHYLGETK